jgi:hypothetical protein
MNEHLNYEDNLFFITARLKVMEDALCLNLDEGLYKELCLRDIYLFDNILSNFYERLTSNKQLLKINDYFFELYRSQSTLVNIVNFILYEHTPFTDSFLSEEDSLRAILSRQKEASLETKDILEKQNEIANDPDVIGVEEYNILLSSNE